MNSDSNENDRDREFVDVMISSIKKILELNGSRDYIRGFMDGYEHYEIGGSSEDYIRGFHDGHEHYRSELKSIIKIFKAYPKGQRKYKK